MKTESKALSAKAKQTIRGRFRVEFLESRTLFAAVSWLATTSGDFNNPANWSNGQVPGVGDDVTISNPAIHVTLDNESPEINSLTTSASIDLTNSAGLELDSVLMLDGGATLSINNNSTLSFDGTEALGGNGTVLFSGTGQNGIVALGGAGTLFTIGSGITIRGSNGSIDHGYYDTSVSIAIQGKVLGDTPGLPIYIGSGVTISGTVDVSAGEVSLESDDTSAATLIASGAGILDLTGNVDTAGLANLHRNGGTVNIDGLVDNQLGGTLALNATTGSLNLTQTGEIFGGTVTSADGAQLVCSSGATFGFGVTLGPGSPIDLATNSATVHVVDDLTLTNTSIDVGGGSMNFYGSDTGSDAQTIAGSGTITVGAHGSLNVAADPEIPTDLVISPGVTITGTGSVTVHDSSLALTNQGTIAATTPGGTLSVVTNGGTFTNDGTLEASNGGTLAIQGDLALDGDGTTNIGIGASGTGTLAISGAATLAGMLNVSLADGFVPPPSQIYSLLTYGSETGNFSMVNLPTTDGTDTTTLGAMVFTLTTPPPTIAQLTVIVADDRSSLSQSKSQRRTTLHNLLLTRNQQQKSLALARRSLAALMRENRQHPSDTLATEIAAQTSQVSSQSQALAQTRQTLSTDIRTDFTDVHPAMKKLLADNRSLRQATQHAGRGG